MKLDFSPFLLDLFSASNIGLEIKKQLNDTLGNISDVLETI